MNSLTLEKVLEKIDEYLCIMEAQQWKKDYKDVLSKIHFIPDKKDPNKGTCEVNGKKSKLILTRSGRSNYNLDDNTLHININELRKEGADTFLYTILHELNHKELNQKSGPLANERYLKSISKSNPLLSGDKEKIKELRDLSKKERKTDIDILKKKRRGQELSKEEKARLSRMELTNATSKIANQKPEQSYHISQDEIEADIGAADDLDTMNKDGKNIVKNSLKRFWKEDKKEYDNSDVILRKTYDKVNDGVLDFDGSPEILRRGIEWEKYKTILNDPNLSKDDKDKIIKRMKSVFITKGTSKKQDKKRQELIGYFKQINDKNSSYNKLSNKIKAQLKHEPIESYIDINGRIKAIEEIENKNINTKPFTQHKRGD